MYFKWPKNKAYITVCTCIVHKKLKHIKRLFFVSTVHCLYILKLLTSMFNSCYAFFSLYSYLLFVTCLIVWLSNVPCIYILICLMTSVCFLVCLGVLLVTLFDLLFNTTYSRKLLYCGVVISYCLCMFS